MFLHTASGVGVAPVATHQLLALSELRQRGNCTILMGHPVVDMDNMKSYELNEEYPT